jgi:hypothetical protein
MLRSSKEGAAYRAPTPREIDWSRAQRFGELLTQAG